LHAEQFVGQKNPDTGGGEVFRQQADKKGNSYEDQDQLACDYQKKLAGRDEIIQFKHL
jgi:hypothetical protein